MFKLLNMSSKPTDDRTTKARIRDAAIECVAEYGLAALTARKVAEIAGISPGSVIHHFGSMEDLRVACDEFVAGTIRRIKSESISEGLELDIAATIRNSDIGSLGGYLAAVLMEDSPAVAKLVDELVADGEKYMAQAVETGMMRPSADPRGRAAVMFMWSLGGLVMHRHMKRILGVDLVDRDLDPRQLAAYGASAYEILGQGIFTEEFSRRAQDGFREIAEEAKGSTSNS